MTSKGEDGEEKHNEWSVTVPQLAAYPRQSALADQGVGTDRPSPYTIHSKERRDVERHGEEVEHRQDKVEPNVRTTTTTAGGRDEGEGRGPRRIPRGGAPTPV